MTPVGESRTASEMVMTSTGSTLKQRLLEKPTIGVIGLGYVGLPLAEAASAAGLRVAGLDTDRAVVASLASGHSHVDDLTDEAHPVVDGAASAE